jgi:CheY-like chemotaxis protein
MYEPFYTTKPKGQGTGLGLNMVFQMVKRLHGAVQVDSTEGEGTTFSLFLPSADIDKDGRQAFTDSGVYVRPELPRGKETVLFVDDELVMLMFVSRILQQLGYNVITRNNGRDAIDYFKQHAAQIDLVLLDWVMPMPDGATVLSAMRAIQPDTTVVITTGFGVDRIPENVLDTVSGFLLKPFGAKEISSIIRDTIDAKK